MNGGLGLWESAGVDQANVADGRARSSTVLGAFPA